VSTKQIIAPFLTPQDIERETDKIRAKYPSTRNIPVDVLGFAEFDLELEFDFAPIQQLKQDAFLRPDLTGIWFDKKSFTDSSFQQRIRFSAAHELAHLFLHRSIYGKLKFKTVNEWIAFIDRIPADQYYWIERHADEFAGRFLMPTADLSLALDETMRDAEKEGVFSLGQESVLEFCCQGMHSDFGVSFSAMQTRLRKSGLWPHAKAAKLSN
jgi:IrrE N-terminal-like domain